MNRAVWKPIGSRAVTPLIYLLLVIMWEAGVRIFHVPVGCCRRRRRLL